VMKMIFSTHLAIDSTKIPGPEHTKHQVSHDTSQMSHDTSQTIQFT